MDDTDIRIAHHPATPDGVVELAERMRLEAIQGYEPAVSVQLKGKVVVVYKRPASLRNEAKII